MNLDDLPPLRESLAAHGLMAKKAFGQHFLLDLNLTAKIARLSGALEGRTVIEVGPGPGGLTRALLGAGARVIAIEKDRRFRPLLDELAVVSGGALTIVEGDALKVDETALLLEHAAGPEAMIVANLPYNVGTALLLKWLTGRFQPDAMILMFQKEVAERIVAKADTEAYGRLSVIAQVLCQVASAVVRLDPRPERPPDALIQALEAVTAAAFGQRRKMLRSSLRNLGGEALCATAGLDADRRAETIPVEGFLALARALNGQAPG